MKELWKKRTIQLGPPERPRPTAIFELYEGGDVWTISQTPKDIRGCKSWKVERYSHGTRTRFALMPTLESARETVVRYITSR